MWLGALLPLMLAGCASLGGTVETDPPTELDDISAEFSLNRLWTVDIGAGLKRADMTLDPVLDGAVIYTADPNGRVMAIATERGRPVWRSDLDDHLTGGVGLTAELVLVGSQEGQLYALARSDGSLRWSVRLSSEILAAPDGNAAYVVAVAQDGTIHTLDAATGATRWVQDIQKPLLSLRGNGRPRVAADMVYLGLDNGKVAAYHLADGSPVWEARIAVPEGTTELERMVDVDMRPLIFSNRLFAASYNGGLMAIDTATGRSEWFQQGSSRRDLAYFGGLIVATMLDSRVVAYNVTSGSQIWESSALLNRDVTAPVAADAFVAVGEREEGYLHLFNRRTGALAARTKVDSSGISANLLIDGQLIYALDRGGDLHAYRVEPR